MKYLIIIFSLLVIGNLSFSDPLYVKIYYLNGEKSKDSHSSEETFLVESYLASYSVKYHGRKGNSQEDAVKECSFTEQNLKNIISTIEKKGLKVNDSLFQESSKIRSIEHYCNIAIDMKVDGEDYIIRINGDVNELDDTDLYKNSVFFITMLRKLIKDC